jgi:alkylation response protein AidB-like acyl-CoA dehydrogenase
MDTGTPLSGSDLTVEEALARARGLVPTLRSRQAATERARRLPKESIDELKRAQLFRILQPRRYGGYEYSLADFVRIAATVASGCGSTGWVYSVATQHNWQIGMFPPELQEEVWGDDPLVISGSSYSPAGTAYPADGGWRLSGSWMFSSGCENVQWMILGARFAPSRDAAPTHQGYVIVPRRDYTVDDNWFVQGLAGTGSKNVVLNEALIPPRRVLTLEEALSGNPPGAAVNPGPLFRVPFFAAISICLCAPILGMAQGALETYVETTRSRMTRGAALSTPKGMAEYPTIQLRVAEAAAGIDAATLLVLRDCDRIMAVHEGGQRLAEAERARNKGDLGFAVRLATQAVDRLVESGGGQSLFDSNLIQRSWRDIHAGAMHISVNWDAVGSLYGRVILGLPAGTAQF